MVTRDIKKYKRRPCEICGYLTCVADKYCTYDICPVCFWEDDGSYEDLEEPSGANHGLTVNQAKNNFKVFGACEEDMIPHVRKPRADETPYIESLDEPLADVVDLLERFHDGEAVLEDIEDTAFTIIAHDEYDKLPEDIQGVLEFLNMQEIESPTIEDSIKARDILKSYLRASRKQHRKNGGRIKS